MMGIQFIGPLIASVLYVVVFQKAGFRGPILIVCAAPFVGSLLTRALIGMLVLGGPSLSMAILISLAMSLAPLFILAFKAWPPVATASPHSEK